ncbi:MAG: TIGR00730 family Rossman fold protein [Betaproteobacteria bacterium]|nr:TIGR00730 family Rossman fold protein [Betaproteobacteria bacterium]MBI2224257.1 TIGR00730 family Rossman fold protein [Betaproteobacteria bacterium]MBI3055225.1 TIGR00730 family Rossman fold protein [Betaproteobacteria bacterium]
MKERQHERRRSAEKAYLKESFLTSSDARPLRILSEYLEPKSRFDHYRIDDTIVFMGSARLVSREQAQAEVRAAERDEGSLERARLRLAMSRYYEDARELARRLTEWSKQLEDQGRRFVVCTGGGPGIMEAANRGASEAKGLNVGLTISIPVEEFDNRYVTRELSFHFHYFFMRKFWFAYLAKALLVFPGGFGTLDEMFEILTLRQTHKMRKHLAIVLFGAEYWEEVINFEALIRHGTIDREDLQLFHRTDSVDEAFEIVTRHLTEYALAERGAIL